MKFILNSCTVEYTNQHSDLNLIMAALNNFDEVQSHILGVIGSLMMSYDLNPAQVEERYKYVRELPAEETGCYPERIYQSQVCEAAPIEAASLEMESSETESMTTVSSVESDEEMSSTALFTRAKTPPSASSSWADLCYESDGSAEPVGLKLYVTTRRDFCSTMARGVKICPRYSTCGDDGCANFHIKPEYICGHVTKGSYCDTEGCDRIVIRACRRGKKCNDSECSFRHR
jgi:hypothetical protein